MLAGTITSSFNQGQFIEKTIRSVLDHDYPDIEYIVMDGGSTGGTVDILKKYGRRIKWRSERDAGQSDDINKGFQSLKALWVGFIDFRHKRFYKGPAWLHHT